MMAKDHQAAPTTDRLRQAGDRAEAQMAFYLRRAFGTAPGVFVFNNLRLEHAGEVAQLDHLVLHRAGMVVVESKSVTSAVRINDRDEWSRQWNGRWQGMASPVLQAQRQADLLRALLQAHRTELLNKMMFGQQAGFGAFVIDVLVAISDQGVIQAQGDRPQVRKADQIPGQIEDLIKEHASLANPLSFRFDKRSFTEGFNLSPEELTRVVSFLRNRHVEAPARSAAEAQRAPERAKPVSAVTVPASAPPSPEPTSARDFKCSKCQGNHLQVQFGRSYYFRCLDCGGNTAIHLTCTTCGTPARTRKSGKEFFAECPSGHSERYFVNP